jgi:hypothetical protein
VPKVLLPRKLCTRFDLPAICLVTGETEDVVWKSINFRARDGSIVPVDLPFTEAAFARWVLTLRTFPIRVMLGFVALVLFSVVATFELERLTGSSLPQLPLMVCLMAGAAPVLALYRRRVRRSGPVFVALDEHTLTLDVPSEAAARALGERATSPKPASTLPWTAKRCPTHASGATFVCSRCGDFGCVPCLGEKPPQPLLCEPCGRVSASEQARFRELAQERSRRQAVLFLVLAVGLGAAVFLAVVLLR